MKTILTLVCLLASFTLLKAQESKKEYDKHFSKDGIEELVISNKHGKIEIVQSEKPEIHVQVSMKVSAKSVAKAEETLNLIQVQESRTGNCLSLETSCGKDMAFSQFISGLSMNIDYKVSLPKGIKLRIINSNGNTYLGNFEGELNVDIENGDFKAASLKGGEFYIKQAKGRFDVEGVAVMSGDFKDCTIALGEGDEVRMTLASSAADFGSLDKLNLRSSGGTVKIADVEDLVGSSSFTKYELQILANLLDMDMKMGEMNIRDVNPLFSEIRLKGSFTKVGLTFPNEAGYQLEVKHNKSLKMDLPNGTVLDERPTSVRNTTVGTKFIGNAKYSGKVFLDLSNGNLFVQ